MLLFNLGFTHGAFSLIPEPGCSWQRLYWAALVGMRDLISKSDSNGTQNPNKIRPRDDSSVLILMPDVARSRIRLELAPKITDRLGFVN